MPSLAISILASCNNGAHFSFGNIHPDRLINTMHFASANKLEKLVIIELIVNICSIKKICSIFELNSHASLSSISISVFIDNLVGKLMLPIPSNLYFF